MTKTLVYQNSSPEGECTYSRYKEGFSEIEVHGKLRRQIITAAKKRGIAPQRFLKRMVDSADFKESLRKVIEASRRKRKLVLKRRRS